MRAFIALETSPQTRHQAGRLIRALAPHAGEVNWVVPENMHLTLKFLGEVELDAIRPVCQAMEAVAAATAPFEFIARGAGAFPRIEHPRTLWLGVDEGREQIAALHKALEDRFAELRFPYEGKRYNPHITLGRVKGNDNSQALAHALAEHETFEAGLTAVDELVLFASELSRRGPEYSVIGTAELRG